MKHKHHKSHRKHENRMTGIGALSTGLLVASIISATIAGMMYFTGIPINTVLPTTAPIWMGFATMLFMLFKK